MNSQVSSKRVVGRARPLIGLLLAVVLLGACRVDNVVTLTVKPNGAGNVALVTTVDAEIVANNPDIASDLSFYDAKAAGWKVWALASNSHSGQKSCCRSEATTHNLVLAHCVVHYNASLKTRYRRNC